MSCQGGTGRDLAGTSSLIEPGEGFEYGWGLYCVQLLVERLVAKDRLFQYIDHHIFGALGMTASTYRPALVPHVWKRRLQMVERKIDASTTDGQACLVARDKDTYGLTCSVSDLARLFGDLMSPDCKLLQRQKHRDLFFTPQLKPGYDVKAHNLAVRFLYDAWKTFG
ncbi:hypothetical protein JDV02_004639 [Purpureocillium takamizusanense]|uniref:Beta-lactamase-related domain-containing protein n=1 Tax=Purpureocillium takamizusanense TaxID=2060973 RepID=A0A9Q8VAZ8_9HYPO|nr:uncharacterized protein JDV02_004639 [Purpureocillium takamizusanense]UNI18366.1 hypothetical protein JDV02_004639 [Purpureocillium takamizusanense]